MLPDVLAALAVAALAGAEPRGSRRPSAVSVACHLLRAWLARRGRPDEREEATDATVAWHEAARQPVVLESVHRLLATARCKRRPPTHHGRGHAWLVSRKRFWV